MTSIEPGESGTRRATQEPSTTDSYMLSNDDNAPQAFDIHHNGHRMPHYDGPYYVHYTADGRRIQKRWYGRLEDGYLAWSSVYLHEYFGFTIYHPLTPVEHENLIHDILPPWIHNFCALPNMAILLSYFCIGVALQLLRTPLIVYFISDHDATPAQVNVLFTVSK